jgi:cytochrome c oxidase subunit 1
MFIAGLLYFIVFFGTLARKRTGDTALSLPESEVYLREKRIPFLDKFKPWLVIMGVVLLLAYVPPLWRISNTAAPKAPPFQVNNPIADTTAVLLK